MISGGARLPALTLRKTSLVPAPPPLSRLRDFHSIDSAQKDSVPSLQEVAETFVCAPMTRPERQWPLPSELYAKLQKILSWTQYSYAVSLQC